jgi:hypothetical protein
MQGELCAMSAANSAAAPTFPMEKIFIAVPP